jgi:hypothetical protein
MTIRQIPLAREWEGAAAIIADDVLELAAKEVVQREIFQYALESNRIRTTGCGITEISLLRQ